MKTHELKTWQPYFDLLKKDIKPFELRKDDRDYQTGDILKLNEYDPKTEKYSGESVSKLVVFILRGGQFGIENGYCAIGLKQLSSKVEGEKSAEIQFLVGRGHETFLTRSFTPLELLKHDEESIIQTLEKPCTESGCNTESQNFCDCGGDFEDAEILTSQYAQQQQQNSVSDEMQIFDLGFKYAQNQSILGPSAYLEQERDKLSAPEQVEEKKTGAEPYPYDGTR